MGKLKSTPIGATDMNEFVRSGSDFDFEMQVLSKLRALGFECSHGGTYQDPISSKIRQFDIRALRQDGRCRLVLSVECKNVRDNFPLLLSSVPRASSEAFHQVISSPRDAIWTKAREMRPPESPYKPGEMVGKRIDQVGRDSNGLLSDDSVTFEKMSQAVNGCCELIREAASKTSDVVVALVPVLLLPNDRLWEIDYDDEGRCVREPHQVSKTSFFVNHAWSTGIPPSEPGEFRLSHIECVTIGHLPSWVSSCFGVGGLFPTTG